MEDSESNPCTCDKHLEKCVCEKDPETGHCVACKDTGCLCEKQAKSDRLRTAAMDTPFRLGV